MGLVMDQFQRLYSGGSVVGLGEWELLRRYLDRGDEDAFRAIMANHGPMVMGVCRRVLGEARDVEDAFQVTFLILARKAGKLTPGDPVGHWLYGVAYRVALRARSAMARRHARERTVPAPEMASIDDPSGFEVGRVIDEELARLPAKYRGPVVLCYLEGLTHEEAARQLGWPVGTVKGRLSRARNLLKGRLSRRGLAPAQQASMIGLIQEARGLVPPSLAERTARAALEIAAGRASGMVSASAAVLLEEGIRTMFFHKLKLGIVALMILGTGAAVIAYQGSKGPGEGANAATKASEPAKEKVAAPAPQDGKAQAPPKEFAGSMDGGGIDESGGPLSEWSVLLDHHPRNKVILNALDKPLAMKFTSETPLEDVIKYIRDSTVDKAAGLPEGIPIYVDPQGLQDADKTMASTISIDLEGIALKTTLRLLLNQLGLTYWVREGLLTITSSQTDDDPSPLDRLMEMARRGELTKEQYKDLMETLKLQIEIAKLKRELEKLEDRGGVMGATGSVSPRLQ
jgi:RNA polymerase sigma factor (sigma-70 family)